MEVIAAIDMCVVPTLTFERLFAFLVLSHGRRQTGGFEVTRHPTAEWLLKFWCRQTELPAFGYSRFPVLCDGHWSVAVNRRGSSTATGLVIARDQTFIGELTPTLLRAARRPGVEVSTWHRSSRTVRLRLVELSENSSMISRARPHSRTRKDMSVRSLHLLVFRWVPLLPSLLGAVPRPWPQNAANRGSGPRLLGAVPRPWPQNAANRGSGPRRNPFLFPI